MGDRPQALLSRFGGRVARQALAPALEPPLLAFAAPRGGPGPLGPGRPSAAEEHASLVPLLVADAAHGLQLRLVGVPLVPVAVLAPFEHVLAPAVARELVANPPAGRRGQRGKPPGSRLPARPSLSKPASEPALHLPESFLGFPKALGMNSNSSPCSQTRL